MARKDSLSGYEVRQEVWRKSDHRNARKSGKVTAVRVRKGVTGAGRFHGATNFREVR